MSKKEWNNLINKGQWIWITKYAQESKFKYNLNILNNAQLHTVNTCTLKMTWKPLFAPVSSKAIQAMGWKNGYAGMLGK